MNGKKRKIFQLWGRWPIFSPLTRRILAINSLTLVIPIVGLLYLDEYRTSLLEAELDLLRSQGRLMAAALANTAVLGPNADGEYRLVPEWSRQSIRHLIGDLNTRVRLFNSDETLIADSYRIAAGGLVEVQPLPPENPSANSKFEEPIIALYDFVIGWLPTTKHFPPYTEPVKQSARDYEEVVKALRGDIDSAIREAGEGKLILTVALPVQRYRHVLGALLVSRESDQVDLALRDTRLTILGIFGLALTATILLSLYLSRTIAWPLGRLAFAAERIRRAKGRPVEIPDLSHRRDEIGDLSLALREMMQSMHARMEATERFAADVAHEIKNPLTSLRSAVETVARIDDIQQQKKLMGIILDDVGRLNRLITDISDASRIDAEMSRDEMQPVNFSGLLETLVDILQSSGGNIELELSSEPFFVLGQEGRLGQVLRNLIANAQSFSPPDRKIHLKAFLRNDKIILWVDDDGPGIPPANLEKIFQRFYSARPEGEKFGTHSGLGLSISRHIAEIHNGQLTAENRLDAKGAIIGARFILELPIIR